MDITCAKFPPLETDLQRVDTAQAPPRVQGCHPSCGGSAVKAPPATQETRVWALGWEDFLEEEMAAHSSILAREIPWTEEPGGL